MTPDPGAAADLETLLGVQELDTVISQLEHRRAALPERHELGDVEAALTRLDGRAAAVRAERDGLMKRQEDLEQQIGALTSRRRSIEERLYGARGGAARDLQAMDDEVRHLRQRRSELEDAELELMVAAEPLDAELGELTAERERVLAVALRLRSVIGEAEASIDDELADRRAVRASAAGSVPQDLLDRYEALRARLGGTGAARLVGNRCSGCHLELPAMEVDRIRRLAPGTVVTCEQCGRILAPESRGERGSAPS